MDQNTLLLNKIYKDLEKEDYVVSTKELAARKKDRDSVEGFMYYQPEIPIIDMLKKIHTDLNKILNNNELHEGGNRSIEEDRNKSDLFFYFHKLYKILDGDNFEDAFKIYKNSLNLYKLKKILEIILGHFPDKELKNIVINLFTNINTYNNIMEKIKKKYNSNTIQFDPSRNDLLIRIFDFGLSPSWATWTS